MSRTTLSQIVRAFGVEPALVRRVSHRHNTHWRVVSPEGVVYFLRRFGGQPDLAADAAWEVEAIRSLGDRGWPVAAPLGKPRLIDGAYFVLLPHLSGRALGKGSTDGDGYLWLGRRLAELHLLLEGLAPPPQRPDCTELLAGSRPRPSQPPRDELMAFLAGRAPALADRLAAAVDAFEARDLAAVFAGAPRQVVHGDFSPWNVLTRGGRLTGVLDFELAHVDVAAADLAFARRGSHDGVVRGYLEVRPLPDAHIAALDALWTGAVLTSAWLELAPALKAGRLDPGALAWCAAQLQKTYPYSGSISA